MIASAEKTKARIFVQPSDVILVLIILLCGAGAFGLARRIDAQASASSHSASEREELYARPEFVRSITPPGVRGLVADYYWMRAVQYVGRKSLARPEGAQLGDLRALDLRSLAPLLDTVVTLDPQFSPAYTYGAVMLPEVDADAAVRLMQKGIEVTPAAWRLRQHLGYIYWQQNRFAEASAEYRAASRIAGAPGWLSVVAARLEGEGDNRAVAREIYTRMIEESDDERIKEMAAQRLLVLVSLDEQDAIRGAINDFRAQANRCPTTWAEAARELRRLNLRLDGQNRPLDPSGAAYALTSGGCDVELDSASQIPRR